MFHLVSLLIPLLLANLAMTSANNNDDAGNVASSVLSSSLPDEHQSADIAGTKNENIDLPTEDARYGVHGSVYDSGEYLI